MDLSLETAKDGLKVVIKGESVSMQDAMEFKKRLSSAISTNAPQKLSVYVEDAYVLPSAIIGTLLKYKEIEKIEIELVAKKKDLMDSLEQLSLAEILNARMGY